MELEFDLDEPLDERKTEAGGKMPPGWYLAKVFDIFPDSANDCTKLEYEITAGPYAGKKVSDTLWDPNSSEDEDGRNKAIQRLKMVAMRIGAIADGETKVRFPKAVGNPVILQLVREQKRKCESCDIPPPKRVRKCPSCSGKISYVDVPDGFVNPKYDGVYPLDHDKVPDEVRQQLGVTVPKRVPRETKQAQEETDKQADKVFGGAVSPSPPTPPVMDKQARLEAELAGF